VAQLAEQLICNQQVTGSSPVVGFLDGFPSGQRGQTVNLLSTTSKVRILPHPFFLFISRGGAVWKLVGLITRRSLVQIQPPLLNTEVLVQYAQIAQLVEQRTENPRVAGSIPALGIFFYGCVAQLVEHLTFNQVVRGSNPRTLILKSL
jgi:hypothetical protein